LIAYLAPRAWGNVAHVDDLALEHYHHQALYQTGVRLADHFLAQLMIAFCWRTL
jgi:hypothetical protein